ncbi:MAG: glycosyltransferase [Candidatus Sungbacteria bacterium]|uniref:Glycosyltransferase n=1 Tax=Candidatus Sungiibacteriota bacterium TaxID=2750080 RepID=A0A931SCK6_9BACT|nr:glycosyltransferase [Candidatus Sungbacteria bacterium]
MTLLTIGSGHRNFSDFLNPKSRERIAAYGTLVDRSFILAFTRPGFEKQTLAENVIAFPTNSSSRWLAPFQAWRMGKAILGLASKGEEIVISAQDPFESGLVAWLLRRRSGARLQLQVHTDFFSPYFRRERWENRVRFRIAKFLLPRADCIRVVSQRIKRSLESQLKIEASKIVTLPIWSVPLDAVPQGAADGAFSILVVARLEKEKQIDHALLAFHKFIKRGGAGKMAIVGDGSERRLLENLARTLKIHNQVVFHGWRDNLSHYYAEADVFLVTSQYEGWGVAAADAVYAGIPVVMTDVGLAGELVRDGGNGIIVPVGDTDAIARALSSIAADPDRFKPRPIRRQESFDEYLARYREALYRCRRD